MMTTSSRLPRPTLVRRAGRLALLVGLTALSACGPDLLQPNLNSPSVDGVDADMRSAVQLRASGALALQRAQMTGFVSDAGIYGRESFNYTPTESRNTIEYLTSTARTNASFSTGNWIARYRNMRGLRDLVALVDRADNNPLSTTERSAAKGFANTLWALEMFYVIATRDSLGAVVSLIDQADSVAAFVQRDSVYRFILGKLDAANAELAAGGSSFPFALHGGFSSFATPATFQRFNRALYARAAVHYATLGGGPTRFTAALTALGQSFIDPAGSLAAGASYPFSAAPGDQLNTISPAASPDQLTHPSFETDAPLKADLTPDNRFTAKIRRLTAARTGPTGQSIPTSLQYTIYPTNISAIPIIRNEELILLRAEANLGLGNVAAAIADIDIIRTRSGGLAPTTLTGSSPAADVLTEILLQKRYSLAFEGHRWIDVRRYGRLNSLPLDVTSHIRLSAQPIPVAECDARTLIIRRIGAAANVPFTGLAAPSCPAVTL
jgi:starch-binding outer membrane protein, SusD/RagB family